ncbi:MAG: cobalt-precorrin-6A reductase [Alphaproteobacteria bacterium]|nr:cobalt-precorrin-6A reductase [Alphaproteobacteria bacterium]
MPSDPSVLVLGGTGDARRLVPALRAAGFATVTSLAGATSDPLLPEGEIRVGGFGGQEGLCAYLRSRTFTAVVDATHPFAEQISRHARAAAQAVGVPYFRFERAPWQAGPGDRWVEVDDIAKACAALPCGARVFLALGRSAADSFLARQDISGVARMIKPPDCPVPTQWTIMLARPPYDLPGERALIARHGITHVVCKNSGSEDAQAKLIAAKEKNIQVIMLQRPVMASAPSFSRVNALIQAIRRLLYP